MVLAVENSLPRAINPLMLGVFIYRVGWSYASCTKTCRRSSSSLATCW